MGRKKEKPVNLSLGITFWLPPTVQGGWRTLLLLFARKNKPAYLQACTANILYIFVIFKCNFRSIWRSRAGDKHKVWCRQARYLVYKCIVACWFTLGADHLTLEGEGGVGDFWSSRIFFFLAIWWAGYFFPFVSHKLSITFVLHAIFFFWQALAGIFFSKSPPPPTPLKS